ncbi:MAG: hypothetical protein GEU26_18210 [Nitrososphaeraceae archaeon]|nr:hypothetical protein [Nitrososphaeraceae archaeon]
MDREFSEYGSSKEALLDLLSHKSRVTQVSENVAYLANGVAYSFIEVTSDDGIQYGLPAYGEESLELNRIAHDYLSKQEEEKALIVQIK